MNMFTLHYLPTRLNANSLILTQCVLQNNVTEPFSPASVNAVAESKALSRFSQFG